MRPLDEIIDGASVALVGNSELILREKPGKLIDRADCVIRINRGIPQVTDPKAVGERTDVWATAKFWSDLQVPSDCSAVLWMKLTPFGEKQLPFMQDRCSRAKCAIYRWPQEREDQCREFVGADPGTGIRLLWWLKHHATPRSVSCYGMDCWEVPSHWSGKRNTINHDPDRERAAMLRLL